MYKTTLHVDFIIKNGGGECGFTDLQVELPFAPTLDVEFDHSVWMDTRKPIGVFYDLDKGTFYVKLEPQLVDGKDEARVYFDTYEAHGWGYSAS